ncbi:periplasmic endochitinase [Shigella dysenteriae]|uniref:Periplasmic endochitinase n=1 Tax=Shigella dysenteriae TaxID=622 RepID=A0A2X2IIS7_SHIDY|nr:periplasmic endochitinase [Shigella dysenteriae]
MGGAANQTTLNNGVLQVYGAANDPTIKGGDNDSNLLIVFYVQIMPDDFVMQLHRF